MQGEKKNIVTTLARLVESVKLECEAIRASSDYGLDRLATTLKDMKPVLDAYLAPEFASIQVDIYPLMGLFALTQGAKQLQQVAEPLMALLPNVIKQMSRTVSNVTTPFFKQIPKSYYIAQPEIYTQCLNLIELDEQCLENYLRIMSALQDVDETQAEAQSVLFEHMCSRMKIDIYEFLLKSILSTDEEISISALTIFMQSNVFEHQYEVQLPLKVSDMLIQAIMKLLRGDAAECSMATQLIGQYIPIEENPFETTEDVQVFYNAICKVLEHFETKDMDMTNWCTEMMLYIIGYGVADLELDLPVYHCLQLVGRLERQDESMKLLFLTHCSHNLINIFLRELNSKFTYSKEMFRQAGFVVEEEGENFRVLKPSRELDQKLGSKLFDFSKKVLDSLSYDQQRQCYQLVQIIGNTVYEGKTQFVYERLLQYLEFGEKFNENLQVFELTKTFIARLDLNSINQLVNRQDYNTFLQQLDDIALAFLIIDMFILINVLPPPDFLQKLFEFQIPLDLCVGLVDNLIFAFHNLQYVAMNEDQATMERRQVCQVLMVNFHQFLSSEAVVYHELVNQPKNFEELCKRILYLQEFIDKIRQANHLDVVSHADSSAFKSRVIQVICDQSLHEIHFPACRCLLQIQFDSEVLQVLLPIVRYIQNAIGEYLEVLVAIFLLISRQFKGQVIAELINLSQIKEQRISMVRFCFQMLVQFRHNNADAEELRDIIKFLVEFLFTSFYDDDEQVMTTAFNQLKLYVHQDVGNVINNVLVLLPYMSRKNAVNVMNSVEAHVLQNGQILLSYIDIADMRAFWHYVQENWVEETNEENSLYSIAQAFLFNLAVKIVFSGDMLVEQDDAQEVKRYFTEYHMGDLSKVIDELSYVQETESDIYAGQAKFTSFTVQMAFLTAVKILKQPVEKEVVRPPYTKLIGIVTMVTSELIGLTYAQFLQNIPSVNQPALQRLLERNRYNDFTICDVIYAIERLAPHLSQVEFQDLMILDLFDLATKTMNQSDCKYDVRSKLVSMVHFLVQSTRNDIVILYGEKQKAKQFWERFGLMRSASQWLKPADRELNDESMVRLLEVLSLGCLYQIQIKLPGFEYVCNGHAQAKTFDEIRGFDNLREENKDKQNVLIRSRISEKDKKLSLCINQLVHIFGHDQQQSKDQAEQAVDEDNDAEDPRFITSSDHRTQLERAMEQLEDFTPLTQSKFKIEMDCLCSALAFSSFTYLINSDVQCFANYLTQINNLFEVKINTLQFVHFADYLENLNKIMNAILPQLALQATDVLVFARILQFLCTIFDKIIFETITENAAELKEKCRCLITRFMSLFVPTTEITNPFLELCAYEYLIAFPFDKAQLEGLTDVFGPETVALILKTSLENIFKRFQDEPTIYKFIINQHIFEQNLIERGTQLIKCYELSGNALEILGGRYLTLFGPEFVDLVATFLQQPLFTQEIVPFQTALARFAQRLGYAMDVDSLILLSFLAKNDLSPPQLQQINRYVIERIKEFDDVVGLSEDFLIKTKSIVQIAQNLPSIPEAEHIVARITQFLIQLQRAGLTSDDGSEQREVNMEQVRMHERFYGLFLLSASFLRTKFPRVYINYQIELGEEVMLLKAIIQRSTHFSATIRTLLIEVIEGNASTTERPVSLWV